MYSVVDIGEKYESQVLLFQAINCRRCHWYWQFLIITNDVVTGDKLIAGVMVWYWWKRKERKRNYLSLVDTQTSFTPRNSLPFKIGLIPIGLIIDRFQLDRLCLCTFFISFFSIETYSYFTYIKIFGAHSDFFTTVTQNRDRTQACCRPTKQIVRLCELNCWCIEPDMYLYGHNSVFIGSVIYRTFCWE